MVCILIKISKLYKLVWKSKRKFFCKINVKVVFVKKGNTYVEGFGDITTDSSGKVTYKDLKTLKFGDSVVLTKVDCEQ